MPEWKCDREVAIDDDKNEWDDGDAYAGDGYYEGKLAKMHPEANENDAEHARDPKNKVCHRHGDDRDSVADREIEPFVAGDQHVDSIDHDAHEANYELRAYHRIREPVQRRCP